MRIKLTVVTMTFCFCLLHSQCGIAQGVRPGVLPRAKAAVVPMPAPAPSQAEAILPASVNAATSTTAPDCNADKYADGTYFNHWFPLSTHTYNTPNHLPDTNDVQCFWGVAGQVAALGQVQYLYGFGQNTNTLSADMLSIQFPAPIGAQLSFGTSVTGGGSTNSSSGQTSIAAAIASLKAGGNFYVNLVYPIGQYRGKYVTVLATGNAKLGFAFNGFAGQSTLSQGTEQYFSAPAEIYAALDGIKAPGAIYIDYRGGLQTVPGSFKTATGLPSNAFGLQQVWAGFNFGVLRIGTQRFFGPAAGFNAPGATNFNKWHLVIQLSPGAVKGS